MRNGRLPEGRTAIGYVNDRPDPAIPLDTITVPDKHRLHAMVLGSSGYGKSTVLKLLIRQNLMRGEGVAVLDPHHDLAAWTARRIPRWRANHLVYISPAQLARTGKAIPINPLEAYGGAPGTAATAFAETLLKAFDTKGVRMEQLLIQAATSLMASRRGGLGLLRRIILDKSERDVVLADVHLRDNLEFWENVFPGIAKEAVPAVDNKLTPIISNPAIGPFFEGRTAFSMSRLIDGGGILVFDGAGCNNDSERMIFTTFLLNMLTTAASKLAQSRPQGARPRPFYVYVDEMQMLDSGKLMEMLQQVRKWGIRITLATQQLESIDAGNAAAMIGNCDLYVVSRCTPNTAKMVAHKMGMSPDELIQVPKYHMDYHMGVPEGDIHGRLMRTRNMDDAAHSWERLEDIVDHSLANYGADVDMAKYANRPEGAYDVTPLEMAMLSVLFHVPAGLDQGGMNEAVARFGPTKRRVAQLLSHLARSGLVQTYTGGPSTMYKLRPAAIDKYFDTAALKGRAGGDLHISTLTALQKHYSSLGYYTRMDVGDTGHPMPDLEVCEPAIGPEGAPDPDRWGRRVAIEVETGPSRHPNKPGNPGQVHRNWRKNRGMTVWFLVYTENDRHVIDRQLAETGVKPDEYETAVISAEDISAGMSVPLPPGFTPADPLPNCSARPPVEGVVLDLVTAGDMRLIELRGKVPATYADREVADAVDRLKADGKIQSYIKKGWTTLRAVS